MAHNLENASRVAAVTMAVNQCPSPHYLVKYWDNGFFKGVVILVNALLLVLPELEVISRGIE